MAEPNGTSTEPTYIPTLQPLFDKTNEPTILTYTPSNFPSLIPTLKSSLQPTITTNEPSSNNPVAIFIESAQPSLIPTVSIIKSHSSKQSNYSSLWMILFIVFLFLCLVCTMLVSCKYMYNRYRRLRNDGGFHEWMMDEDQDTSDYLDDIWGDTTGDDENDFYNSNKDNKRSNGNRNKSNNNKNSSHNNRNGGSGSSDTQPMFHRLSQPNSSSSSREFFAPSPITPRTPME